jgi:hypothetical protein
VSGGARDLMEGKGFEGELAAGRIWWSGREQIESLDAGLNRFSHLI